MLNNCEFCDTNLENINESFLYCMQCNVVYNKNYSSASYENSYFVDEYKNQYGRTYLEDKENLQRKMNQRLDIFRKITRYSPRNDNLLEIGSAAGFFLEIAKNAGFNAEGWEVSRYMSDYANKNGNTTTTGDFLVLLENNKKKFSIVSAFYVLEHFSNQKKIWNSLNNIINPGGYLLLTLPSISGPLYRFHRSKWVETHPVDHYIDYSHKGIKKISSMSGFKLLHMEAEGLHPDRFPLGSLPGFRRSIRKIQKIFAYSDTIYAIFRKI